MAVAAPAAALSQPDGTVIPQGNALRNFLRAQSYGGQPESIDPLTDAATTPERFKPGCTLTFTVIGRGAGQNNSFGWYNVTGSKPKKSELYEFLTCSDGVGTVRQLDIASDPRWAGGEIGFFQATTEGAAGNCVAFPLSDTGSNPTLGYVFYSEKAYNDDNTSPNPFIHLLIMDSKVFPSAFYFGWEDLFAGGDNDFEDLLTRVEGITCTGGGAACAVSGAHGRCAEGVTQCRNGALVCEPQFPAQPEACNGFDDDCDGETDEGDDLCPSDKVCYQGRCQPPCGDGEFACAPGLTCNQAGLCVDPACDGVTCDDGKVCVRGVCKGACDDVTCPHGLTCFNGNCVDRCQGVTCDAGYQCHDGVCQQCSCGANTDLCTGGQVCQPTTQQCVEPACSGVSCEAGKHCEAGSCVSNCRGAVCPVGQRCEEATGTCETDPNAPDGGAGTGGVGFPDGGILGGSAGTSGSAGTGAAGSGGRAGSGGAGAGFGQNGDVTEGKGCGCALPGQASSAGAGLAALALGGLLLARRRRYGAGSGL